MKKVFLGLGAFAIVAMSSCEKLGIDSETVMDSLEYESEAITVSQGGFEITESASLTEGADGQYTSGVIQYTKNGEVLASVDFGAGSEDNIAEISTNGSSYEISLEGKYDCDEDKDETNIFGKKKKKGKKEKPKFKKVIVTPLVKAEECQEIVSGIIKFYDYETGDWKATIDFGDGICDDTATKTTADGANDFSISEHLSK